MRITTAAPKAPKAPKQSLEKQLMPLMKAMNAASARMYGKLTFRKKHKDIEVCGLDHNVDIDKGELLHLIKSISDNGKSVVSFVNGGGGGYAGILFTFKESTYLLRMLDDEVEVKPYGPIHITAYYLAFPNDEELKKRGGKK